MIGLVIYKNREYLFEKNHLKKLSYFSIEFVFFITGASYLLGMIIIRWIFYFDEYSFRILGPGTFLIFVSFDFRMLQIQKIAAKNTATTKFPICDDD